MPPFHVGQQPEETLARGLAQQGLGKVWVPGPRVGSRTVELYMTGKPDALRAWAQRVITLADELTEDEPAEGEGAGDA